MDNQEKNNLINEYGEEAIKAYIELVGEEYASKKNFEDSYSGKWESDEEFVQDLLEGTGDIPKDMPSYIHIDWEWTAREIMMDYNEQDGFYFRNC